MQNVEKFKKALGKEGELMSNEEAQKLHDQLSMLTNIVFDKWKDKLKLTGTETKTYSNNGNCRVLWYIEVLYVAY